jgi:hypothetical protein
MSKDFIITHSGRPFYPFAPRTEDIRLSDGAHALSMLCRYAGQINRFYSVGAHCIQVSRRVEAAGGSRREILTGLLHDFSEQYFSDIPSPVKHQFPEIIKFEDKIQEVVAQRFDLPYPFPKIVHDADSDAGLLEARILFAKIPEWAIKKEYNLKSSCGHFITFPKEISCWGHEKNSTIDNPIQTSTMEEIEQLFINRFIEIGDM